MTPAPPRPGQHGRSHSGPTNHQGRPRRRPGLGSTLTLALLAAVAGVLLGRTSIQQPLAATASTGGAQQSSCTLSAKLVPSCGRLWGAAPEAFSGMTADTATNKFESSLGSSTDIYHGYHTNNDLFPNSHELAVANNAAHPHLLFLNYKPATDMTWRQVANGAADSRIDREANYIKQNYNKPFFMTIWHEPENDVNPAAGSGRTAQDYHDMFRHVVQRFRADGANKLVFVMDYQGYPKFTSEPWYHQLYPGDDVVDWIASDSYNMGYQSGWDTGDFSNMVNRTRQSWPGFYNYFSKTHPDKPLMLGEWGVFVHQPEQLTSFFDTMRNQLPNYPKLKALVYFNSAHAPKGATSFDATASSKQAFQQLTSSVTRVSTSSLRSPGSGTSTTSGSGTGSGTATGSGSGSQPTASPTGNGCTGSK